MDYPKSDLNIIPCKTWNDVYKKVMEYQASLQQTAITVTMIRCFSTTAEKVFDAFLDWEIIRKWFFTKEVEKAVNETKNGSEHAWNILLGRLKEIVR